MNNRNLALLPLSLLLLLVGLTFWLSSYVTNEASNQASNQRNDPDVIIEKFSAQKLSPAGDVQYVMTADKMTHYPKDDSSILDTVIFTAFTPGQPTLTARAPRARSRQSVGDGGIVTGSSGGSGSEIVLDGGVVIDTEASLTSPAMQLTTPKLTILPDENIARSVDGVKIQSVQGVMNAASFELNNQTQELKMATFNARLKTGRQLATK
jgi:lipopolysaccharide export system protein LptC